MKLNIKLLIPVICFLVNCFNSELSASITYPRAVSGVLDLRQWDFRKQGTLKLSGEWEFYWKQLLTPEDFTKKSQPEKTGFLKIPGVWNKFKIDDKALNGYGYATLRLKILTGDSENKLGLEVPWHYTSYKLWCNGLEVSSNGIVGTCLENSAADPLPRIVFLKPENNQINLVLQISNYQMSKGGVTSSYKIGLDSEIQKAMNFKLFSDVFMSGCMFIMLFYHLGLFMLRKKDLSALYFSIVCFAIFARTMAMGQTYLLSQFYPGFNYELRIKIVYGGFIIFVPFIVKFIGSVYYKERNRFFENFIFYGGLLSLSILLLPAKYSSRLLQIVELIALIGVIYIIVVLVKIIRRKRSGAAIASAGFLVLLATGVNDILNNNQIITTGNFAGFGMLGFTFSQAFLLAVKFSDSFSAVEQLSSEIEVKNRTLMTLDKLKDEFLANTSHELKTPLHGIIGIAESITDGAKGEMPENIRHDLSLIVKSGRRLSGLINDILDFSKIRNSDPQLSLRTVDLTSVVSLVIDLLRPMADKKGISLTSGIPDDARYINADEDRLVQMLLNLADNAIKFTSEGGVTISSGISSHDESFVDIVVSDTGIGIKEDDIAKIFNAFEQGDGSVSRTYGGTGLGLAIVQKLAELHGGRISVDSEAGKGSVFSLSLQKADDTLPEPADSEELLKIKQKLLNSAAVLSSNEETVSNQTIEAGPYILIVDDDAVNIHILKNILQSRNYEVHAVMNGCEAIEKITMKKPDLVMLDIMMPGMSGIECAEKIRASFSHADLPLIMLTAKNRTEDITSGFSAGANDYLTKPFEKDELISRVKTLLQVKDAYEIRSRFQVMEEQVEMARNIQMFTLPDSMPEIPGLDIAARYIPMDSVGGDFYNYRIMDNGIVSFFIADVSGHGIPAAIIASMVHLGFTTLIDVSQDPLEFMTRLRDMMEKGIDNHFVTASCCAVDNRNNAVRFVRAGHEPLILIDRKERKISSYLPKGPAIGILSGVQYRSVEFPFVSGSRIVLYTDGIHETLNQEMKLFGIDRFEELLRKTSDLSADDACDRIIDEIRDWRSTQQPFNDDITLMIIDKK